MTQDQRQVLLRSDRPPLVPQDRLTSESARPWNRCQGHMIQPKPWQGLVTALVESTAIIRIERDNVCEAPSLESAQ